MEVDSKIYTIPTAYNNFVTRCLNPSKKRADEIKRIRFIQWLLTEILKFDYVPLYLGLLLVNSIPIEKIKEL